MTQEELPERSGLIVRYISAIERADVSANVLGRIADALGMEPEAPIRKAKFRIGPRVAARERAVNSAVASERRVCAPSWTQNPLCGFPES